MGNLGEFSSAKNKNFYMTTSGTNVNAFNTSSGGNVHQDTSAKKARPQTENGRMRARRNTTEVTSTADVTGESPDNTSNISASAKKRMVATSTHTPRFSVTGRTNSQIGLERSTIVSTPGPADYRTEVESCV